MQANYHTHTIRCHHATGTEREYIEAAIRAGLTELGFSDHAPYPFSDGHTSNFRMSLEEASGYFDTLEKLREEYRDKIKIRLGLEAEYYPVDFSEFLHFIRRFPCEYLILGQHFLNNESDGAYSGEPTTETARLERYVDQVCEGLDTGVFTYLAHPDLLNWQGSEAVYRRLTEKLCRHAKAADIPLEINLLGLRDNRWYPRESFWQVAGEVGNRVVLGCDAHEPQVLLDRSTEEKAKGLASSVGLTPELLLSLRPVR